MPLTNSITVIVSILISVAFYTILERKILSYIQIRKGPNKVGFMGILQPFSDAIKLFNKSLITPIPMNIAFAISTPTLSFFLSLIMWPLFPLAKFSTMDSPINTIILLIISSLSVYSILLVGWAGNSKYSLLGSIRSVAQMISYEASFFIFLLLFLILFHSYNMSNFHLPQLYMWFLLGMFPLFMTWVTICLAEVNRTPFDFAEGESELVSGFNVEYLGGLFALIFLAEYTNILILSAFTTILFSGSLNNLSSIILFMFMSILFLWARGTLPRFRYDLLMTLNWKMILPVSIFLLIPLTCFSFSFF